MKVKLHLDPISKEGKKNFFSYFTSNSVRKLLPPLASEKAHKTFKAGTKSKCAWNAFIIIACCWCQMRACVCVCVCSLFVKNIFFGVRNKKVKNFHLSEGTLICWTILPFTSNPPSSPHHTFLGFFYWFYYIFSRKCMHANIWLEDMDSKLCKNIFALWVCICMVKIQSFYLNICCEMKGKRWRRRKQKFHKWFIEERWWSSRFFSTLLINANLYLSLSFLLGYW